MKRICSLLLILTVLMCGTVFAEDIDISSMSDEELVVLQDKIRTELELRNASEGDILLAGRYEVGVDIAAGKYNFVSVEAESSLVSLYDSKEACDSYAVRESMLSSPGSPVYVVLEDGQWVWVTDDLIVTPARKSNFAP